MTLMWRRALPPRESDGRPDQGSVAEMRSCSMGNLFSTTFSPGVPIALIGYVPYRCPRCKE